jgi:GNAT superfamily N-acetyltransferase
MRIRPAVDVDLPTVIAIEANAGKLFREVNMAAVADSELFTVEQLLPAVRDGRVLVAVEDDDSTLAFVLNSWVDGRAHLDQVSVDPTCAGRGLGRELIAAAEQWGRGRGSSAMTLTTFADVPWNGPYYRRLGWRDLPAAELGPELAAIRRHEASLGLDAWSRTAMIKPL